MKNNGVVYAYYSEPYDKYSFIPALVNYYKIHLSDILDKNIADNVDMFGFYVVECINLHKEHERLNKQ